MKNAFDKFISRLDIAKKTISELENRSREITKTEPQTGKTRKGKKQNKQQKQRSAYRAMRQYQQPSIYVIKILKADGKETRKSKYSKR